MLSVSSYTEDYVDACRAKVAAQLTSYRKVSTARPSEIEAFERQFFNHMVLALDRSPQPQHGGQGREMAHPPERIWRALTQGP
jgi:hypothetical protein